MTRIIKTIVLEEIPPKRVDMYLAERYRYQSRTGWQKAIKDKKISVNGNIIGKSNFKINTGDTITYEGIGREEPAVNADYSIIYSDTHFIVVNKPGNLPVHPAGRYFHHSLSMILEKDLGKKIYTVHRLDRETSGVIIFALSSEASSAMQKSLNSAKKSYRAVVHGIPDWSEKRVDTPIGDDEESAIRKKRKACKGADQSATTLFKLVKTYKDFSLIEALPETGRLHQIRVHLLSENLPIVGDKLYGLDETFYLSFIEGKITEEISRRLILPRCGLHAEKLTIYHPYLEKTITFNAPLPEDMASFIHSLK